MVVHPADGGVQELDVVHGSGGFEFLDGVEIQRCPVLLAVAIKRGKKGLTHVRTLSQAEGGKRIKWWSRWIILGAKNCLGVESASILDLGVDCVVSSEESSSLWKIEIISLSLKTDPWHGFC